MSIAWVNKIEKTCNLNFSFVTYPHKRNSNFNNQWSMGSLVVEIYKYVDHLQLGVVSSRQEAILCFFHNIQNPTNQAIFHYTLLRFIFGRLYKHSIKIACFRSLGDLCYLNVSQHYNNVNLHCIYVDKHQGYVNLQSSYVSQLRGNVYLHSYNIDEHQGDVNLHYHNVSLYRYNVNIHNFDVNQHRCNVSQYCFNVFKQYGCVFSDGGNLIHRFFNLCCSYSVVILNLYEYGRMHRYNSCAYCRDGHRPHYTGIPVTCMVQ